MERPNFHDGTDIVSTLEHLTRQQLLEACIEVPLRYSQKRSRKTLIVAIQEASPAHQDAIRRAATAIEGTRKRPADSDWDGVQPLKRRKIDRGANALTETNGTSFSVGPQNQASSCHVDSITDTIMEDNTNISTSVGIIRSQ